MVMQPRLAATVMLLRNTAQQQGIEIFMVRRVVQSGIAHLTGPHTWPVRPRRTNVR